MFLNLLHLRFIWLLRTLFQFVYKIIICMDRFNIALVFVDGGLGFRFIYLCVGY